jgi:hypothetical protein
MSWITPPRGVGLEFDRGYHFLTSLLLGSAGATAQVLDSSAGQEPPFQVGHEARPEGTRSDLRECNSQCAPVGS